MDSKPDDLFSWQSGQELRDAGTEQVLVNAPDDWSAAFDAELQRLATTGLPFTSEDITRIVGLPRTVGSSGNNAVGAKMIGAAKRNLIRKVGYAQAVRPNQHAAMLSQWVGVKP